MTPISIRALRHSAFYSPLLIAINGGFLHKQGLEPQYSVATPENTVLQGLQSGTVQVAQSAIATSWMDQQQQAAGVVHFAQINQRDGFFLCGRIPEPEFKWSNLIGKQVLIDHFFQPYAMFKYALHKQGIDIDSLQVIDAGNVEQIDQAFRAGQGDYVHQQGPAPQQLEKEGKGYIVAAIGDSVGDVAFSSLCATREWLQTEMAQVFMYAYRQAREYTRQASPAELAGQLREFFPAIDPDVLQATIATYQTLGCWEGDTDITPATYAATAEVFVFSGYQQNILPYEQVVMCLSS